LKDADRELKQLQSIVTDPALAKEPASFSPNTADRILRIASETVAGEIAGRKGDIDRALLHLERAVRFQDALIYTEPPDWHAPVRLTLGAVRSGPVGRGSGRSIGRTSGRIPRTGGRCSA
jgi:hypothetical protein